MSDAQRFADNFAVSVAELKRLANRLGLTWRMIPGTVTKTFGVTSAAILLDVDTEVSTPAQSLIGQLYVNQRVMVICTPNGANYVIGYYGGTNAAPGVPIYVPENTSIPVSSTGYTAQSPTIGTAVVAPPSGQIRIDYTAVLRAGTSATNICLVTPQVRLGATVGSGTVFYAATDNDAVQQTGTVDIRSAGFIIVSGLTAGKSYNVELLARVNAATGNVNRRKLIVTPVR